jgi:RecA/RadA recombinase
MVARKKTTRVEKRSKKASEAKPKFAFDYGAILGDVEKKFRITSGYASNVDRMHSGSLILDLLTAGGIYPGRWYSFIGKEASGKSTALMSIAGASITANVPLRLYYDFEGSVETGYFSQMLPMKISVDDLFGVKDAKTGKYVKRGLIDHYTPDVAETFFDSVASLLRRMPDKVFVKERNKWYLVFEDNKQNKTYKEHSDRSLSGDGHIYVEAEDGSPQAVIFLDSYPAMLPDRLDEDDAGSGMAAQARMFSEQLKKVRPKLRRKHVTVIGVNQLRMRPGPSFGNPEYEPCGEAVKFVTDGRVIMRAVSIPKHAVGTGKVAEEDSVLSKGNDSYRYIKCQMAKNKMGPNFREGYLRVWMDDPKGKGHGFDPVFDVWEYLHLTGQLNGNMKKFEITIAETKKTYKMSWYDLKELVLCKGDALRKVHKKLKLKERLDLRKIARRQLKTGASELLYSEAKNKGKEKPTEE